MQWHFSIPGGLKSQMGRKETARPDGLEHCWRIVWRLESEACIGEPRGPKLSPAHTDRGSQGRRGLDAPRLGKARLSSALRESQQWRPTQSSTGHDIALRSRSPGVACLSFPWVKTCLRECSSCTRRHQHPIALQASNWSGSPVPHARC